MDSKFQRLIDKIKDHKVLLLCGPNVSASSKDLPAWDVLVGRLREKLNLPADIDTPTLSNVAQLYVYPESRDETRNEALRKGSDPEAGKEREQRRLTLARLIAIFLDDPTVAPSDVHRYIAALPFNRIVTTNWDNLLERAFSQMHKPCVTVVHDADIASTREGVTTVVKLCGSVEQPESLRITLNDILRRVPEEKPAVMSFLSHAAVTKTLLFLGFDFSDYDFKQMYDTLLGSDPTSKRDIVAVQSKAIKDTDYWQRRDVEFVDATMQSFLRQVSEALEVSLPAAQECPTNARAGVPSSGEYAGLTIQHALDEEGEGSEPRADFDLEIRQLNQRLHRLVSKKKEGGSLSVENQIRQVKSELDRLRRKGFAAGKY